MTLDENLSWDLHVKELCNSLTKYFGIFYNLRSTLTVSLKKLLYYSFVQSRINYGVEIYGSCRKTLLNKIQILQNKLLKVLFNKPYRTGTNDLHRELQLLKVNDLYKLRVLNFVYKAVNRESIDQFCNYFPSRVNIHDHNTRQKKQLVVKNVKTNFGKSSVYFQGANLWNTYSQHCESAKTCNSLKRALNNVFLNNYN